jgi:murein L,D-transpeptidase YcbB/YkuD
MLPEKMPDQYIWANIPSYTLLFIRHDTLLLSSRIVVGKPKTRTPVLTSALYEMITYPQWNIPQSIIVNEILPALKKDPGYLASKGYSLFKGEEEVDPYTVDWSQYKKGIPYRIIQGSGDDNALGVLKFNFHNKYAVYLHDTNQRSYFALDNRALSHGCVRIQEWQKLAVIIMQIESEKSNVNSKQKPVSADSLFHWLKVKEKRSAPLINRVPIFIRYFTCEASDGRISFFDDIYEEDEQLSRMLFASKKSKE